MINIGIVKSKSVVNPRNLTSGVIKTASSAPVLVGFVSTWKTDNTGVSANNQITLPIGNGGPGLYNATVDWGDGNEGTITSSSDATHTYSSAGTYTVTIIGTMEGFAFKNGGDKSKLLNIANWGGLRPSSAGMLFDYFYGCNNLTITATDNCDMSTAVSARNMFNGCSSITTIPSINDWDWSNVFSFEGTFFGMTLFNQDLPLIPTTATTTMALMFRDSPLFNGTFNYSATTNVTNFTEALNNTAYNQAGLDNLDLTSATNMQGFLDATSSFDQDISSWNPALVSNMVNMLRGVTLSTVNYDAFLIALDALPTLVSGVTRHFGSSKYSAGTAATARASILSKYGGSIIDGGQV